jgi:hypothetical protein
MTYSDILFGTLIASEITLCKFKDTLPDMKRIREEL